ncbi:MAG: S9 family peptidase [Cyclobacteriaceae bacterium]|nr:DPP IV N-terminal domain-containing protein [Cyclobacteriaceae bacterium]MCB9239281.1 DPP IV N-terminal domain-containing protein [Flammeovirgaceae bacterium]MCO5271404.1 S9 family peptidase [Cyclobacteriaceae bacterium]
MKNILSMLVCAMLASFAVAQRQPVTTANYELASRFSPDNLKRMVFSTKVEPHWLKNSARFWYEYETPEGKFYYIVDPKLKSKAQLFDHDKLAADMTRLTGDPFDRKNLDIEEMEFINNETAIRIEVKSKLVEVEDKDIDEENGNMQDNDKRKNGKKKMKPMSYFFEYGLLSRQLRLLEGYEKPKEDKEWANIAPNEQYVLFSRNFNLYWMDMENYNKALKDGKDSTIVEHQLTTDGVEYYSYGTGTRGETNVDKEKNKDKRKPVSVEWSPDSKKFAMVRTDERLVKDLWVVNSVASPRPTLETYKYQMPGEKESPKDELIVFDFDAKSQMKIEADTFPDQVLDIFSAPRLKKDRDDRRKPRLWLSATSDKLYFSRTSRDLKRIDVCVADTKTGKVKVLVRERLNTYVEIETPGLVNNGQEFIQWSERDGWGHFYLYNGDGTLKNQITSGPFHCERIEGIDEKNRALYFTANGRESNEDPYYLHLYKINFNGTGMKLLNPGDYDNQVDLNDGQTYFVNNFSRVNTTPVSVLSDASGNQVMPLEVADLSTLFQAGYRFPEPFKVKAGDGATDLYGVMYKPYDFDSTRLYPLIEYVYPGPQTEAVYKSFTTNMDRTDRLAQLGFVVITVGNRGGHPARSKRYHNYGYQNLRDYGLLDKKVAAEQLAYRHGYIDINKVGIFGHSGGGFMSTAAMLVYPDFFKVAVSSSGNHENAIYNRWWSEKHHGVKETTNDKGEVVFEYSIDDNPELAKNLKGKLLITTGDIDNNVHPGNTILLANALIKANKRFDFFLFPGQRHGYGDMNEYFFWMKADYFSKYLMGDNSPRSVDYTELNMARPQK